MTAQQILSSKSAIDRYSTLGMAQNVAARAHRPSSVILGDDGRYWVTTRGKAEVLHRSGFQYA